MNTVLGALVLARGRSVSYETLSSHLWGWSPPTSRQAQIYTYIYKLRKQLGDQVSLVRSHGGYQLNIRDCFFDVTEFENLVGRGQQLLANGDFHAAATKLGAATALWRGRPLANVTDHLGELERPPLEEALVNAEEHRISAELAIGRHAGLIPELNSLVTRHPLREQFRAQLIVALHRSNRQAEALLAYHDGRQLLADQLGVDPGPEMTKAYEAALNGDPAERPVRDETVLVTAQARPTTVLLPPNVDPYIGHEPELQSAESAIVAARQQASRTTPFRFLVTGPIGSGKTAFAVRTAHNCTDLFTDGVVFTEAVNADGQPYPPQEVLTRLLEGLGRDVEPGADLAKLIQLYRSACQDRCILVVLDNVIKEQNVELFVPNGPHSAIIMTSPDHLPCVARKDTVTLGPLPSSDGVRLLAEVGGEDAVMQDLPAARAVVEFCDSLPLALRIAGAKLAARSHWTVSDLAARLANPARRLDELSYGQQTVRRSLMSAVHRLPSAAQALLAEIGGVAVQDFDAQMLSGNSARLSDTEQRLELLADAQIVYSVSMAADGSSRFRITALNRLLAMEMARSTGC
ncbi:AfsR/SARP family transcriptional regulator [Paractinoplanes brasiliensis]|nr:AfsR/SARP family transcriptional regulator [Actinoplanes brasiliensis]